MLAPPLLFVPFSQAGEMRAQRYLEGAGQHSHPVLASLGLPNNELPAIKLQILDAQAQPFHQP